MHARLATIAFATLFFLFAFAADSRGQTVTVPLGSGSASITFPTTWKVSSVKRGPEAKTKDDEVYVWAEAVNDANFPTIMKEHEEYFTGQNVALKGPPKTETRKVNGLTMTVIEAQATWKGAPTMLQYLIVDPGFPSGWKLMLTEWASPEGDRQYQKDLDSIQNSLAFSAR